MLKVGLTGGYASGKSFVASEMERLGCFIIYADKLGHAVLQPDGEAYGPALETFGPEILAHDGTIDRKQLGSLVFASPDLLQKLTGFVHPAVFRLEEAMLRRFAEKNPRGIAVVEAAILLETGRYKFFDRMILTACSEEVQIARGMKRDGLTRDQILARLASQMPLAEKKHYVQYVINTGAPKHETIARIQTVVEDLKRLQEAAQ